MTNKIAVSMMCADLMDMKGTLETLEENKIDYLHIDIMDGEFVPNFTLGTDFCKSMRKNSSIPLDIHMMVMKPEDKLKYFDIQQGDVVSVHAETTAHLQKVLAELKAMGAKPFVALNPSTPLCFLENVLGDIDGVLIMTVNPGFAGQKLVERTLNKISDTRKMLDENGYSDVEIEVDGNVSFENAKRMKEAGANIFVTGTSSVFSKEMPMKENIDKLKEILG